MQPTYGQRTVQRHSMRGPTPFWGMRALNQQGRGVAPPACRDRAKTCHDSAADQPRHFAPPAHPLPENSSAGTRRATDTPSYKARKNSRCWPNSSTALVSWSSLYQHPRSPPCAVLHCHAFIRAGCTPQQVSRMIGEKKGPSVRTHCHRCQITVPARRLLWGAAAGQLTRRLPDATHARPPQLQQPSRPRHRTQWPAGHDPVAQCRARSAGSQLRTSAHTQPSRTLCHKRQAQQCTHTRQESAGHMTQPNHCFMQALTAHPPQRHAAGVAWELAGSGHVLRQGAAQLIHAHCLSSVPAKADPCAAAAAPAATTRVRSCRLLRQECGELFSRAARVTAAAPAHCCCCCCRVPGGAAWTGCPLAGRPALPAAS